MLIPLLIAAGGVGLVALAARYYLKGPRCRGANGCRVLVVGNSITAYGRYARMLDSSLPNYTFDVRGVVGHGTSQILNTLRSAGPSNYDEIIIEGGLNDLGRGREAIVSGLERLVKTAKASGARVILLKLTPWHRDPSTIQSINRELTWKAPLWGVDKLVDVWSPLADNRGGLRSDLIGDAQMGVHPNDRGHALMAQAIYDSAY
jgi:hypothetical protein